MYIKCVCVKEKEKKIKVKEKKKDGRHLSLVIVDLWSTEEQEERKRMQCVKPPSTRSSPACTPLPVPLGRRVVDPVDPSALSQKDTYSWWLMGRGEGISGRHSRTEPGPGNT